MKYVTGLPKIEFVDCDTSADSVTEEQTNIQLEKWTATHSDWVAQEKRRRNRENKLYQKDKKRNNWK